MQNQLAEQKLLRGKDTVAAIKARIEEETKALKEKNITPSLAIVRVGDNKDDIAYERSVVKKCDTMGIACNTFEFEDNISKAAFEEAFTAINKDAKIHGILLLQPLPKQLDENAIINLLDPKKDLDGMTKENHADIYQGKEEGFAPCTAEAVIRLLEHEKIALEGKDVVIVGRSLIVGKPLAMMMIKRNATVTVCHTRTKNLKEKLKQADIIISAAGTKGLVTKDSVNSAAIVVDVGIHVDENGKMSGDVDTYSVGSAASQITPVPGGVGGVTSWLLIEHVVKAAQMQQS